MFNNFRILPVAVLAIALSPLAANARTGDVSHNPGGTQYLSAPAQIATNSQGRPSEFTPAGRQTLTDVAPEYAAAANHDNGGEPAVF
jgi:hypothetical protein